MRTSLALLVLLAGCGGSHAAAPRPSATMPPGPTAFTAQASTSAFGDKDLSSATADQLLNLGNTACDGFGSGLTFGRIVQGYAESDAHPSQAEAEAFTRLAVTNLCPQYAAQLP